MFPKEFTVNAKGLELIKARLLGRRYESISLPWKMVSYLYKGKHYITYYGKIK